MAITLSVGGVPEHFNYLWHLPEFAERLAECDVAVEWHDYPGGTGAMCADLREGSLDIALLLTEGAIADIAKGNPSHIIGSWVASPLTWGIHANASRANDELPELSAATYAISRYGSGSHLMAIINCQLRGLPLPESFEVVGNMDGARDALAKGQADYFLWEKFTTKFLVDSGEFQRIDHCDTPWPCFVLVALDDCINHYSAELDSLMAILREMIQAHPPTQSLQFIADRYQLETNDVTAWAADVCWSAEPGLDQSVLDQAVDGLLAAGVLEQRPERPQIVWEADSD